MNGFVESEYSNKKDEDFDFSFEKEIKDETSYGEISSGQIIHNLKNYISIINNLDEGIVVIDTNMVITFCNNIALKSIKKPLKEVIGSKCYKCLGKDTPCDDCMLIDSMDNKQILKSYRFRDEKWIARKAVPIIDKDNKVLGGIEFWKDITDAKNAEKEVLDKQRRIENTLKCANILYWKYHVKTMKIEFSSIWDDLIGGKKPAEILNDGIFERWVFYKDLDKLMNMINDLVYKGKTSASCEIRLNKNITKTKWLNIKGLVEERDEYYMPEVISGICQDISPQKDAQKREKESALRLKRILDLAVIGTWEYDTITNQLHLDENVRKMINIDEGSPVIATKQFIKRYFYEDDFAEIIGEIEKFIIGEEDSLSFNLKFKNSYVEEQWYNIKGFATERDETGRYVKGQGIIVKINN